MTSFFSFAPRRKHLARREKEGVESTLTRSPCQVIDTGNTVLTASGELKKMCDLSARLVRASL